MPGGETRNRKGTWRTSEAWWIVEGSKWALSPRLPPMRLVLRVLVHAEGAPRGERSAEGAAKPSGLVENEEAGVADIIAMARGATAAAATVQRMASFQCEMGGELIVRWRRPRKPHTQTTPQTRGQEVGNL